MITQKESVVEVWKLVDMTKNPYISNIGTSIFRKSNLRKRSSRRIEYSSFHLLQTEKEIPEGDRGMEDIRKMILFLIINILAFLCFLLGKENRRKRENEHEKE